MIPGAAKDIIFSVRIPVRGMDDRMGKVMRIVEEIRQYVIDRSEVYRPYATSEESENESLYRILPPF